MKADKVYEAIGNIDDKYINEVIETKKVRYIRLSKVACVLVAIMAIFSMLTYTRSEFGGSNLLIRVEDCLKTFNTLGSVTRYTPIYVEDISDLFSGSGWNEDTRIRELPVFFYKAGYYEEKPDYEEFDRKCKKWFDELINTFSYDRSKLRLEFYDLEHKYGDTYIDPFRRMMGYDLLFSSQIRVRDVSGYGDAPYIISKELSFVVTEGSMDEKIKNARDVIDYCDLLFDLPDKYRFEIKKGYLESPGVRPRVMVYLWESDNRSDVNLVNFFFNRIEITAVYDSNDGKNYPIMITQYHTENLETAGVYKVISVKEARDMIEKGYFFGGHYCPLCMEKNEPIDFSDDAYVDLIYLNGPTSGLYLPYYAFYQYVGKADNGMDKYAAIYVPAVKVEGMDRYFNSLAEQHEELMNEALQ